MKSFVVLSVICFQLNWSFGTPVGVSSFAYQDSSGQRYGGTYQIPDGQFDQYYGPKDLPFQIPFQQNYYTPQEDYFPDYYRNLQYLIQDITETRNFDSSEDIEPARTSSSRRQFGFEPFPPLRPFRPFKPFRPLKPLRPLIRPFDIEPPNLDIHRGAFQSNLANQNLALDAARKAFELTSNQAAYVPYFPFRSGFDDFGMFGGGASNSAFAGAAAGPGFTHQIAAISPSNPLIRNVNVVNRFSDIQPQPGSNFVSMSSKAYSMSSNIDGQQISNRGAETIVNNNGKITEYSVKN